MMGGFGVIAEIAGYASMGGCGSLCVSEYELFSLSCVGVGNSALMDAIGMNLLHTYVLTFLLRVAVSRQTLSGVEVVLRPRRV